MHISQRTKRYKTRVIIKASVVFKTMSFRHPSYYWELGKTSQLKQMMPHSSKKGTGIFYGN